MRAVAVIVLVLASGCLFRGCSPGWEMEWEQDGIFTAVDDEILPLQSGHGFSHPRADATYGVYGLVLVEWQPADHPIKFQVHSRPSVVADMPTDVGDATLRAAFLELLEHISTETVEVRERRADELIEQRSRSTEIAMGRKQHVVDVDGLDFGEVYGRPGQAPVGPLGRAVEVVGEFTFHFDLAQKHVVLIGEEEYALAVDRMDRARFTGERSRTFSSAGDDRRYAEEGRRLLDDYLVGHGIDTGPSAGVEFREASPC